MRHSYLFHINKSSDLRALLHSKSKNVDYISILESNTQIGGSKLPLNYINYDLIAAVDALEVLEVNRDGFRSLREFHLKHQDWLFGYLSYDLKNELEEINSKNHDGILAPLLSFFVPKYILLLKGNKLEVCTYETKEDCEQFLRVPTATKDDVGPSFIIQQREKKHVYIDKIVKIKEKIQRGDIYEMNYCQEFFAKDVSLNPEHLFQRLNRSTMTPFSSFLKLDYIFAMSASPERFIRKSENKIISQPIKGTRKRDINKQQDLIFAQELKDSQKDLSENVMIVDLVRNDLSITAIKGSVKVSELYGVYTFEKAHQMISTVVSEVDKEEHFSEILRSVFPMGSMTGAPKLKAMQLIEEFEGFKRGMFSGAIGYVTPKGDFDFNVVIRTILYNARRKYLSIGVGGAITIKSDPNEEYEECLVKIRPIFEALNFELDEE